VEERRQSPPAAPLGYIDRLPARILLNRLPVPMWAVHDGEVLYANRAFEEMLGHPAGSLDGTAAADLLADGTGDGVSVEMMLRERAGRLLGLRHADGSIAKVIVSSPMLRREDDTVTLVGVQDVTEYVWEKGF
jgi:PAS domain S-box-containing protein